MEHTMEGWEEEFDEKFEHIYHDQREGIIDLDYSSLKDFIRSLLATAHREMEEKIRAEIRGEFKGLEANWMALKDDYSEICRALGFKGDAWFGDPLTPHREIVAKAKELAALATLSSKQK